MLNEAQVVAIICTAFHTAECINDVFSLTETPESDFEENSSTAQAAGLAKLVEGFSKFALFSNKE